MRKLPFTTPIWAEGISVEQKTSALIVSGKNHVGEPVGGVAVANDLLAQSVPVAWWPEDRRKKPPHVAFANATTEAKLIEFVKTWGPVDGTPEVCFIEGPSYTSDRGLKLVVRQNLRRLRFEQRTFSGAARLVAEIQCDKPDPERIFNCLVQLQTEHKDSFSRFARSLSLNSDRTLADAACEVAESDLCELLDRFPARLFPTTAGPVEFPPMDLRGSRGRGVKHVLYGFLRLEYLRKDRLGLGLCPKCNEVFAKERRGAVCCSELCSKQHRSLKYYLEHGRARRQKRAATAKQHHSRTTASTKRNRT